MHAATAALVELEAKHAPANLADMDTFWEVVDRLATAKDTLNLLESADMAQLLKMCVEDE